MQSIVRGPDGEPSISRIIIVTSLTISAFALLVGMTGWR